MEMVVTTGLREIWVMQSSSRIITTYIQFLPMRRTKRGICYGNVGGWVSVRHMPVLYQNGQTYQHFFNHLAAPSF